MIMTNFVKVLPIKIKAKVNNFLFIFKYIYTFIQKKSFVRLILACLIPSFVFGIVFFLNVKTPIHGDDYIYSYIFTTYDRITSLSDIIKSQEIHYMVWGGRSVVHSILQMVLTLPDRIIDVLNSLVFLLFILSLYFHAKGRGRNSFILFGGMFLLTWILQPVFGDTVLWVTGSVNYLWGTTIILLFLLPYRMYSGKGKSRLIMSVFLGLLFFLFGVVAGWTIENTALAMIVMIVLFLLFFRLKKWHIPLWALTGLVGSVIGYVLMIAAPGNFVRAGDAGTSLLKIVYNTVTTTQAFIQYLGVLLLLLSILYVIYFRMTLLQKSSVSLVMIIYLIGAFVGAYSMVVSPFFAARSWFGIISLVIIAFGVLLYRLDSDYTSIKIIKSALLAVGLCLFMSSFYEAYKDVSRIENKRKAQYAAIVEAKKESLNVVRIKKIAPETKFGLLDAPYALDHMSHYYGIEIEFEK